jgi:hypothetical protein
MDGWVEPLGPCRLVMNDLSTCSQYYIHICPICKIVRWVSEELNRSVLLMRRALFLIVSPKNNLE